MASPFSLSHFDFPLSDSQIARAPASPRDSARLLLVQPGVEPDTLIDQRVSDLPQWLKHGDVLVVNTTKVFPARLLGKRGSGGKVEVLLLHQNKPGVWTCLGRALPEPHHTHGIIFSKRLRAQVLEKNTDGTCVIQFSLNGTALWKEIERLGHVPLPPYLKNVPENAAVRKNYQTVFAKQRGSAAAPTAGLHFTPRLLTQLKKMGVQIVPVTLHVGWGTFALIREHDIRQHQMHAEWGEISASSRKIIAQAHQEKRRIFAVGTTALRVVEAAARDIKHKTGGWSGWISVYIKPGDKLRMINGLLTNFHLPKTTLFVLICSIIGTQRARTVYAEAVKRNFRWASFGDAMLIIPD